MEYTAEPGDDGSYKLPYTGQPAAMGVKSIVANKTGKVFTPSADYIVRYAIDVDESGTLTEGDVRFQSDGHEWGDQAPTEVGTYLVIAMTNEASKNFGNAGSEINKAFIDGSGWIAEGFEVTYRSLEGAVAVKKGNPSVTEFTYNTEDQKSDVSFAIDGVELDSTDYSVQFYNADGTVASEVKNAGDYTAVLTGKGSYQNSQVKIPFTVDKLDLSTAQYVADDVQTNETGFNSTDIVSVNGEITVSQIWGEINQVQTSYYDPVDQKVYGPSDEGFEQFAGSPANDKGAYSFQITAKDGNANITGTGEYTVNVVEKVIPATDFLYDGKQLDTTDGLEDRLFDLSKGESYDAARVTVTGLKSGEFTVTPATADAAQPGEYTAVARVNVPADYSVGGSSSANFDVTAGVIDTDTIAAVVIIDGVNVPFGETHDAGQYTGNAVVPSISLMAGDTALAEGTDYTVEIVDEGGNAVDQMVDAGTYIVTIKSDTYKIENANWFKVRIDKRQLDSVAVSQPVEDADGNPGIPYTGSAIDLQLVGKYTVNDKPFEITMDPSWYLLSGLQHMAPDAEKYSLATQVLEVGDYKANLSMQTACKNYEWTVTNPISFRVVDTAFFTDVAADQWYAGEVYQAAKNGYVNGVGDTKLFMPDNDISRAELTQVMFNMAGQSVREGIAYPTPFSDVPELAWFAQPVSWASEAGVVTGIGDTGTFAPYDNATREQVATMFYRYAAAQGTDASGVADLSGYTDAASVSDWAEQAVAWAVEAGVFGQGTDALRPSDPISRAEVAAMAVRLQPERVETADPLA